MYKATETIKIKRMMIRNYTSNFFKNSSKDTKINVCEIELFSIYPPIAFNLLECCN